MAKNWQAREQKIRSKKNRMPKHGKTSLQVISNMDRTPAAVIDNSLGKKNNRKCPSCGNPKNKKAQFCKDCQNNPIIPENI